MRTFDRRVTLLAMFVISVLLLTYLGSRTDGRPRNENLTDVEVRAARNPEPSGSDDSADVDKNGLIAAPNRTAQSCCNYPYLMFFTTDGYDKGVKNPDWPHRDFKDPDFLPGRNPDLYAVLDRRVYRISPKSEESEALYSTRGLALAPDGERVALVRREGGSEYLEVANRSGNFRRVILRRDLDLSRSPILGMDWSPDGRFIVYAIRDRIFTIRVADGDVTELGHGRLPDWSPSGRHIAFEGRGQKGIMTMKANGSGRRIIDPMLSEPGEQPVWSPDGTKIIFHGNDGDRVVYMTITPEGTQRETVWESDNDPPGFAWQARCTIRGVEKGEYGRLEGTPGDDIICGGTGSETILGRGGNDILLGGPGRDVLVGGKGRDVLNGQEGRDRHYGSSGDDLVVDLHGRDFLSGGRDNDHLYARDQGLDEVRGGGGRDVCWGNQGRDTETSC